MGAPTTVIGKELHLSLVNQIHEKSNVTQHTKFANKTEQNTDQRLVPFTAQQISWTRNDRITN